MTNDSKKPPMRVLCVDDDSCILRLLEITLRPCGYELFLTSNPEEALQLVRDQKIDTIVSDHRMPRMDGMELLSLVARLHPQVFRVLLTAHATMDLALAAINEGHVHRFLVKPWSTPEIRAALKHAEWELEQRRAKDNAGTAAVQPKKRSGYGVVELDEKLFDSIAEDTRDLMGVA